MNISCAIDRSRRREEADFSAYLQEPPPHVGGHDAPGKFCAVLKRLFIGCLIAGCFIAFPCHAENLRGMISSVHPLATEAGLNALKSGGNAMNFAVRFTDVYANTGGKWQMVTWQSTRLPE